MQRAKTMVPLYWTTSSFWIAVFLNILVVSLFETIFYFYYATTLEKEVLENDVDRYTDLFARQIQHTVTDKERERLVARLQKAVDNLDADAEASTAKHRRDKRRLFVQAIVYESVIVGVLLLVLAISAIRWYMTKDGMRGWFASLHMKHILLELFLVFILYVVFDFLYVNFVMKKWQSMRATEFQKNIIEGSGIQMRTMPAIERTYTAISSVLSYFNEKQECVDQ